MIWFINVQWVKLYHFFVNFVEYLYFFLDKKVWKFTFCAFLGSSWPLLQKFSSEMVRAVSPAAILSADKWVAQNSSPVLGLSSGSAFLAPAQTISALRMLYSGIMVYFWEMGCLPWSSFNLGWCFRIAKASLIPPLYQELSVVRIFDSMLYLSWTRVTCWQGIL